MEVQLTRTKKNFLASPESKLFEISIVQSDDSSAYASGLPAFAKPRNGI